VIPTYPIPITAMFNFLTFSSANAYLLGYVQTSCEETAVILDILSISLPSIDHRLIVTIQTAGKGLAKLVSIIVCTMRSSYMDNIFDNYERQQVRRKELIIILNKDNMNITQWQKKANEYKNVSIYRVQEKDNLGKCLNFAINKANYDIIAKFDDDDYYAPRYLNEAINALKEKSASIIGKSTSYIYFEGQKALMIFRNGNERKYRRHIKGGSLVFRKAVWDKVKFPEHLVAKSDAAFIRQCKREGYKVYSVSKYNYVCVRREDISSHTQRKSTEKYMAQCKLVCVTNDYKPIITKEF